MNSDEEDFNYLNKNAEFGDFDEFSNNEFVFSTSASASSVVSSNQNSPRPISDWSITPVNNE